MYRLSPVKRKEVLAMTRKRDIPGESDDAIFTALYFGAEQTQLPHEPSYDVDRGLQRFSAWLDDQPGQAQTPAEDHAAPSQKRPVRPGGSFFRRARVVSREPATAEELRERLIQLDRLIELKALDPKQAAVNVREEKAARMLIDAIADIPQACLRLGSVLVVKYQDAGGSVLLTRNLSQLEMHALERFPEILENPSQALEALAEAAASDDD